MEIFLLRHFESEKNVKDTMSNNDEEKLTLKGKKECKRFSYLFKKFCVEKNFQISEISAVDSCRAQETANIISSVFEDMEVKCYSALRSTNAGNLAGKSLNDIQKEDPFFSKHYSLYRKGLLNLYFLDEHWSDTKKESKRDFEKRVMNCFDEIIREKKSDDILIVGHRASITAILINIARKIGLYSDDFYGSVDVSLGLLSWITLSENKKEWTINCVNSKIEEILKMSSII